MVAGCLQSEGLSTLQHRLLAKQVANIESVKGISYCFDDDSHNGCIPESAMSSAPHPSLLRSHVTLPATVRYGLPLLLIGNAALLLYSNLTLGASVHARVYDGQGRTMELPVLYNVSLAGSIKDMWQSGAYWMATLIAICSGAWPHVKLLLCLLCWTLDEKHLSPCTRRRALKVTYFLQKFSHVETITLVILMTAFSFTARLPNHESWGVWTYVAPQPGFFAFLGGLILSMFLSRVTLYYDQASHAALSYEESSAPSTPMECDEQAHGSSSKDCGKAQCMSNERFLSNKVRFDCCGSDEPLTSVGGSLEHFMWREILTVCGVLCIGVCLIMGLVLPGFSFQFKGLTGWILDNVTQDSPDSSASLRTMSALSLGEQIPASSDSKGIGTFFLQASFFFFVVGAPISCLTLLVALLILKPRDARKLVMPAEILYAWSSPDVLFISMVVSTREMYLFVRFVIGDRCDAVNALLREIMDDQLAGDDKCFDVVTSLKPGCFILGVSSLLFLVAGFLVMRKVKRMVKVHADVLPHKDTERLQRC
jgi:hypothetical protein